jgi:HNH endonuclease
VWHLRWPDGEIDHINGDRSDNRWENLRDATHAENHRNMRISKRNTSGRVGVSWGKAQQQWQAYISMDGKLLHLGFFGSWDDASSAREAAERHLGFHANHGSAPKAMRAA